MSDTMATTVSLSSDRRTLLRFYLLTCLVCGGSIFAHWLSHGRLDAAIVRTGIFAVAMAIVHVVGYYAYSRQWLLPKEQSKISASLANSAKFNLAWQFWVLALASILLDGGVLFRSCALASAGYWAGAGLIALRRPASQSAGDVVFLCSGWFFLLPVVVLLIVLAPRLAGH
jgi:hypothetical protein